MFGLLMQCYTLYLSENAELIRFTELTNRQRPKTKRSMVIATLPKRNNIYYGRPNTISDSE